MTKQHRKHSFPIRTTILVAMALLIGGKWYSYVAYGDTPFDDFGSSINAVMPGPINRMGCDMLKKRFGNVPISPRGCGEDGRWA